MTNRSLPHFSAIVAALVLLAGCAGTASRPATTAAATRQPATPEDLRRRDQWLEMFARGYFPGRSGQLFVIPAEGTVITERDPLYGFMHGSPWDYDTHIPLLFHGQGLVTRGSFAAPATQQDVAATLAAAIGAPALPTFTGQVLRDALVPGAPAPRVVVLLVMDGMRADAFAHYASVMPTLSRLKAEGAWFGNTRINYLPTLTSVGHATIGTGTDPRFHGLAANNLFNRVTRRPQPAYDKLDPRELMALTLADSWNLATDGRAIIAGQGGAIRAAAGLVGRGACLVNGRPVLAASYATRDAGWETNPECYRMPAYLSAINGKTYWEAAGGRWMGHDISNPSLFRASSLYQRFEGDALVAVATQEAFGADGITDLLLVNMKGPDYVSHAYGPDAPEMRALYEELDRQVTRLLEVIDRKAGPGGRLLALTADHGMPSDPPPGRRYFTSQIVDRLHAQFDPGGKALVTYYGDAANNQIFLDPARLEALKITPAQITRWLETEDYLAAAFTEDEVRAAQRRLPAPRR
jgi:hypothetical protein